MPASRLLLPPADFATVALDLLTEEVKRHYRSSWQTITRWLGQQTPEWRATREARIAGRREALRLSGLHRFKQRPKKALPEGFYELALTMTQMDLSRHLGCACSTVGRMIDKLPPEQRRAVSEAGQERKLQARLREIAKAEAGRPSAAASPKAKRRGAPVNWGFGKPTAVAPAQGGVASMAATHLRRKGFIPVYNHRKAITGSEFGDTWVVGNCRLSTAAMIELARGEGWDSEGWRQMPAQTEGARA